MTGAITKSLHDETMEKIRSTWSSIRDALDSLAGMIDDAMSLISHIPYLGDKINDHWDWLREQYDHTADALTRFYDIAVCPSELSAAADALTEVATSLRTAAEQVTESSLTGDDSWSGAAADQYRGRLQGQRDALDQAASAAETMAGALTAVVETIAALVSEVSISIGTTLTTLISAAVTQANPMTFVPAITSAAAALASFSTSLDASLAEADAEFRTASDTLTGVTGVLPDQWPYFADDGSAPAPEPESGGGGGGGGGTGGGGGGGSMPTPSPPTLDTAADPAPEPDPAPEDRPFDDTAAYSDQDEVFAEADWNAPGIQARAALQADRDDAVQEMRDLARSTGVDPTGTPEQIAQDIAQRAETDPSLAADADKARELAGDIDELSTRLDVSAEMMADSATQDVVASRDEQVIIDGPDTADQLDIMSLSQDDSGQYSFHAYEAAGGSSPDLVGHETASGTWVQEGSGGYLTDLISGPNVDPRLVGWIDQHVDDPQYATLNEQLRGDGVLVSYDLVNARNDGSVLVRPFDVGEVRLRLGDDGLEVVGDTQIV